MAEIEPIALENFICGDKFCASICELMEEFDIEEEDLGSLDDSWTCKVELTTLEPMFKLTAADIEEMLYNNNEERYSEDMPESEHIIKALNTCVDFEKLNSMIPNLYYANNKFVTVTKADLIEYCQ